MKYYIGIDLGGMSAKAGLMNEEGNILCIAHCVTAASDTAETTAAHLAGLAKQLVDEQEIPVSDVAAIGVGSPGVIDSGSSPSARNCPSLSPTTPTRRRSARRSTAAAGDTATA